MPVFAEQRGPDSYLDTRADAAPTPQLQWTGCQDSFLCGTAKVPLDYDHPRGTKIDLSLIKLPASDPKRRIGTLFMSFGGPGLFGTDIFKGGAKLPGFLSDELRSRFDLVSWDQRGVSRKTPVR